MVLRAFGIALLITSAGCSTHYQPRLSPRLTMVMEGGNIAYQKNGETFSHGLTGGGLVEAVADDPQALEAAETYQGRMTAGLITYMVGLACGIGGVVYAIRVDTQDDTPRSDTQSAVITGTLGCFIAGVATGIGLFVSGQPYQFDAVNIYNDNIDTRYRYAPPLPVTAPLPEPSAAPLPEPSAPAQ